MTDFQREIRNMLQGFEERQKKRAALRKFRNAKQRHEYKTGAIPKYSPLNEYRRRDEMLQP